MNQIEESSRTLNETEEEPSSRWVVPPHEEVSLLDLLVALATRRKRILQIVGCCTLIGIILALVLPIRYTATISILPPRQNNSVGAALMSQLGSLGALTSLAGGSSMGLKNPNDLQVALLKSQTVEDAMVDRFHLMDLYHVKLKSMARKKLEDVVDIDDGAKDGLIRLSVTDASAKRSSEMANGYVDEFKRFSATLAVTEASQRRLFFENQMVQAKDNLTQAEEELKKTEQKTGVLQLDAQARSAIAFAADLRAQIAAKQVEISAMRAYATGDNPQLQIAEQQLAGLQAQEAKLASGGSNPANAFLSKGSLQESSLEYIQKLRNVRYQETIFDLLAQQYEIAKVDEAREGATIQIVDPATVPDHRSSPHRTLIVIGFLIFGLIISFIWALTGETLERISKNPEEKSRLEALRRALSRRSTE